MAGAAVATSGPFSVRYGARVIEADFLRTTRDSYDALAADHVDLVCTDLTERHLDHGLLTAFAGYVRATGEATVLDVGCGAGRLTGFLSGYGLSVSGVDLSPRMVEVARRTYPELRFTVGSMLALDVPDASLGGVLAYYSFIHVPWELRPVVFAEFHRILIPGGYLFLGFQIGDDRRHYAEYDGLSLGFDFYRQRPDDLAGLLTEAGFEVHIVATRQPEPTIPTENLPQGYLLARKAAGTER